MPPVSDETRTKLSISLKGKNKGNTFAKGHKGVYGEKNIMWKGENAGYHALHKWISAARGNPKECELCFRTDKKKYEWASKTHKYLRDVSDWMRVCTSCHRKYDIEHNNYRVAYLH